MGKELAWGNAGNISARLNNDRYLITSSGIFLGDLNEKDLLSVHYKTLAFFCQKAVNHQKRFRCLMQSIKIDLRSTQHSCLGAGR